MRTFSKKESLAVAALSVVATVPCYRLFMKVPVVGVSIATIPITSYLLDRFKATPVLKKVLGILAFVTLMWVSWIFAEVIVGLMAVAMGLEALLLWKCIREQYKPETKNGVRIESLEPI